MKKKGFLTGVAIGTIAGAVMGVMFDPMTKCENAIEEMVK